MSERNFIMEHNGTMHFYEQPVRFIPARVEQCLEHYIRSASLLRYSSFYIDLEGMEA